MLHLQAVDRVFQALRRDAPVRPGDLPEKRLVFLGVAPQHVGFDLSGTLDQNVQPGFADALADLRERCVRSSPRIRFGIIRWATQKFGAGRQRRAQPLQRQRLRPQFAREYRS